MFLGFSTQRIDFIPEILSNSGRWALATEQADLQSTSRPTYDACMNVHLTNPHKDVIVPGPTRVRDLLQHLNLIPEAYLVIREDELVTEDELLQDSDSIEIRAVISGG